MFRNTSIEGCLCRRFTVQRPAPVGFVLDPGPNRLSNDVTDEPIHIDRGVWGSHLSSMIDYSNSRQRSRRFAGRKRRHRSLPAQSRRRVRRAFRDPSGQNLTNNTRTPTHLLVKDATVRRCYRPDSSVFGPSGTGRPRPTTRQPPFRGRSRFRSRSRSIAIPAPWWLGPQESSPVPL
jgi:hypothetical protein